MEPGFRGLVASLRHVGAALLFGAVAAALGAAPWQAVCVALAAALVAVVERRCGLRDGGAMAPSVARDGKREMAARVLALELACDRSESVLESLLEGVVVVDSTGEIVLANPAVRNALARSEIDPLGCVLWDELPIELSQAAREAWLALHDSGVEELGERPTMRRTSVASGEKFYDLAAVSVTSRTTGQDFGTVFLFVDTTRNHELQRLKDRFLSSVSHELRTPLTSIRAYSEILETMIPGESMEWPEFVRVIHEESIQLSTLVDAMFDFLQLESGDAQFTIRAIDAPAIVEEVAAAFGQAIASREIELELATGRVEGQALADRTRFAQVCRHLIDNAIKFTPVGGHLRVACGEHEGAFELRVEDSGPGIPLMDRNTVFEQFTQLADHLTAKPEGAGLGLAVCRSIVERCGGAIWCEDSEAGGAAFVVRLPIELPMTPAATLSEASGEASQRLPDSVSIS